MQKQEHRARWKVEEAYFYDPVGNRLTGPHREAYTYDVANRLTQDSTHTYAYDANGNLIEKRSLKDGHVTTYTYDAEDHLTRVVTPKAEVTFQYDPLGRRTEKRVIRWHDEDGDREPDKDEEGPARVLRYLYDQEDILATFNDSGRELARYTHGPGIDEPLAELRGHRARFHHADVLGSIVALTEKHGHPVRAYRYSAFGLPEDHKGDPQPYRYTGREWDKEVGVYYYRARYYAPRQGRFLQEDPLRIAIRGNFFAYVSSNPLKWTDPLGLIEWPFDAPMPWNEGSENTPGLLPGALVPTYGNWGGPGWSGGQRGDEGSRPPIDSMDECFKLHDECWAERNCRKNDAPVRRRCNRELVDCLTRLRNNPRNWVRPAPNPAWARGYQWGATWIFRGMSRL